MSDRKLRNIFTLIIAVLGILAFISAVAVRHVRLSVSLPAAFSYGAGVLSVRFAYQLGKLENAWHDFFKRREQVSDEPSGFAVFSTRCTGYLLCLIALILWMFV